MDLPRSELFFEKCRNGFAPQGIVFGGKVAMDLPRRELFFGKKVVMDLRRREWFLGKKSSGSTILLTLHEHASVRSGKYGPYIYYKTSTMKKPRFLKLKGIKWKDYTASGLWAWAQSEYSL